MFILKWVYPTALISHCLLGAIIYRCARLPRSEESDRFIRSGVSLGRVAFDVSGESLHMPCRHGVLGIAVRSHAAYATQRVHVRSRSLGEAGTAASQPRSVPATEWLVAQAHRPADRCMEAAHLRLVRDCRHRRARKSASEIRAPGQPHSAFGTVQLALCCGAKCAISAITGWGGPRVCCRTRVPAPTPALNGTVLRQCWVKLLRMRRRRPLAKVRPLVLCL